MLLKTSREYLRQIISVLGLVRICNTKAIRNLMGTSAETCGSIRHEKDFTAKKISPQSKTEAFPYGAKRAMECHRYANHQG
jgi:hypothetical protein